MFSFSTCTTDFNFKFWLQLIVHELKNSIIDHVDNILTISDFSSERKDEKLVITLKKI